MSTKLSIFHVYYFFEKQGCLISCAYFNFLKTAWTAFIQRIDNRGDDYCPYDISLGDFFTKTCAPGASSRLQNNATVDSRFCKLCNEAFTASKNNGKSHSHNNSFYSATQPQY